MYMVDIGASRDDVPTVHAARLYLDSARNLLKKSSINIVDSKVDVIDGVRTRMSHWGTIVDATLMDNCGSNLAPMGQKVLRPGFTFIWSRAKLPCFISPDCTPIVIFDLHGVVPIYSPAEEEMKYTMLGSFELDANDFRKTCGVYLAKHGTLGVDIHPPDHKSRHHARRKDRLAGNADLGGPYDGNDVVYKRAAEARKRFVTLPKHALDK